MSDEVLFAAAPWLLAVCAAGVLVASHLLVFSVASRPIVYRGIFDERPLTVSAFPELAAQIEIEQVEVDRLRRERDAAVSEVARQDMLRRRYLRRSRILRGALELVTDREGYLNG